MADIYKRKEALEFLKKSGTKVALQTCHDGKYVFAEKTDFISTVLKGSLYCTFVDYDGNGTSVHTHDNVLHVPAGVS